MLSKRDEWGVRNTMARPSLAAADNTIQHEGAAIVDIGGEWRNVFWLTRSMPIKAHPVSTRKERLFRGAAMGGGLWCREWGWCPSRGMRQPLDKRWAVRSDRLRGRFFPGSCPF